MSGAERWVEGKGGTFVVPGYPDDGREYGEITPGSEVAGQEVVVWFRAQHLWGRAVSDPTPGAHIDITWSLARQARYYLLFVENVDLDEYIAAVSAGRAPRPEILSYVPITKTWLVPKERGVPMPRSAGAGAA